MSEHSGFDRAWARERPDAALDRIVELEAENHRLREKAGAYDAARSTVKIEGNTRAFYVLRAERAEAENERLREALTPLVELAEQFRGRGIYAEGNAIIDAAREALR